MKAHRQDFAALTAPYRAELLVHCYRMLGSAHEAEDMVQETYLRAWRSFDGFEGRASMRTYLYRIATNACLTALDGRSRRMMPADGETLQLWLEPLPDAAHESRTNVRLAFIAALQHLPPIRRAVLILRDVLALSAAEAAEVLGTTIAAVNSALPRARAQIAQIAPAADGIAEPAEPRRRALLDRYVAAFQEADIGALARLMRDDIMLEMPPLREWFRGREAVVDFFADNVLREPGVFRMRATGANGQLACVAHLHGQPHAVHVLTLQAGGITHIAVFLDPATVALFPD